MSPDQHDTVVVEDVRGSATGAVLGIIAILVLLAAVWYFALGPGAAPTTTTNPNPDGGAPAATDAPAAS